MTNHSTDFIIQDHELKKYRGPGGKVVVPSGVVRIGDAAFAECMTLTSVTLPSGVTHIGTQAFCRCRKLVCIDIPDSLVCVDDEAFYHCRKLTAIRIPDGVTSIGDRAFEGCHALMGLTLPDSIRGVGTGAFRDCRLLADAHGRIIVRNVLYDTIDRFDEAEELTVPDTVTHISRGALRLYSGKTVRWLGKGTVEPGVFWNLHCIVAPNLPFAIFDQPDIRNAAMRGFVRETDAYQDEAIRADYIRCAVTQRKKLLPDIFAEDRVPMLAIYAEKKKITNANFDTEYMTPAMEANATGCVALLLDWRSRHLSRMSIDQELDLELMKDPFSAAEMKKLWSYKPQPDGTLVLTSYKGDAADIEIPERVGRKLVTALGEHLFSLYLPEGTQKPSARRTILRRIQSVVIPEGITHIGASAFHGCTGLTTVTLPSGLTHIGASAFRGCTGLTDLTLPDSVMHIGDGAFIGCNALADAGGFVIVRQTLYHYCGTNEHVTVPSGVTHIGAEAFRDNTVLMGVTVPSGVTHIGEAAFMGCDNLTRLTLPDSVTHIGGLAFSLCFDLTIHAPSGSFAEACADAHDIPCVAK